MNEFQWIPKNSPPQRVKKKQCVAGFRAEGWAGGFRDSMEFRAQDFFFLSTTIPLWYPSIHYNNNKNNETRYKIRKQQPR